MDPGRIWALGAGGQVSGKGQEEGQAHRLAMTRLDGASIWQLPSYSAPQGEQTAAGDLQLGEGVHRGGSAARGVGRVPGAVRKSRAHCPPEASRRPSVMVLTLGLATCHPGRSPGKGNGNPLQCSCLGNPMDRGAWWAAAHGVTQSEMTEELALHFFSPATCD